MINRFILNETSYFGCGARKEIYAEIKKRGYKKALLVADKDLVGFGTVKLVTDCLKEIPYDIFTDFKANPTVDNVKAGVQAFAASGADFLIAVGGGSARPAPSACARLQNRDLLARK